MNKSERLLQLLTLLRSRRRAITAKELADRMSVSERTIYRDVQSLVLSGVAIEGEAGVGYQLQPGASVPPLMFTEQEVEALMLGIRMVKALADDEVLEHSNTALDKIKAVLPDRMMHELNHKHTKYLIPDYGRKQRAANLDVIRSAIECFSVCNIEYLDAKERKSSRSVYPLGLVFWGSNWTLISWCCLRQAYRSFRVDRVVEFCATEENFQTGPELSLKHYLQFYDENVSTDFWG